MDITNSFCARSLTIIFLVALSYWGHPFYAHSSSAQDESYQIFIHTGKVSDAIDLFKSRNFWGAETHDADLDVPRIIMAVASERWDDESEDIEVEVKKELFYRVIVPMVLLSNELIEKERTEIEAMAAPIKSGDTLKPEQQSRLDAFAEKYELEETADTAELLSQLLERVDVIPASLALGQAAYESGYGTSRFAQEGNALFGQWTYSGDGMKPKEHRASKGDYGVASYQWPFDSVRSYMFNLNTHDAYQALREKRAAIRKKGKQPTGLELAETLDKYSEKGAEYVKTLKGIITVNNLTITDQAYLRDEPVTLTVGVPKEKKSADIESEIDRLRASGELDRIVDDMKLQ